MMQLLLEPFAYTYMTRAIWLCALVGAACAFLSCYLMLKGWSLMGDALAHSVIPGVALAYLLALPYALGAFGAGLLAALAMSLVKQITKLREDAVIGLVFTAFLAVGLLLTSINPVAVNLNAIILGNILAISAADAAQVVIISLLCLGVLSWRWRDFMLLFFDQRQARISGINPLLGRVIFFTMLSAAVVAALQTVGACLVIAMVITPGASAYLLSDRFGLLIVLAVAMGALTSAVGAYLSYFANVPPGGFIVALQSLIFLLILLFAPKHGMLAVRKSRALQSSA